ncbi:hypothetical protein HJG60_012232 [Phyllostomus discolor]|uniref:Uncharacterized protein n=1 Tax=Phyllostomus discolor TaxID=89673 RepID=A0A833ZB63_9CHIR|nr:hypothetical protein HJG60_012232 [Phyllostomus discolor]
MFTPTETYTVTHTCIHTLGTHLHQYIHTHTDMHKHSHTYVHKHNHMHLHLYAHTPTNLVRQIRTRKLPLECLRLLLFGHPSQRYPGWRESNDPTYEAPTMTTQKLKHWLIGLGLGFQDPGGPLSPVGNKQLI